MRRKIHAPPDADLSLTAVKLAGIYGISTNVTRRWKREANMPLKQGLSGTRPNSLALHVSEEEWAMGCHHVAKLLGISHQAAWVARNRLIKEGRTLPILKKGRGRNLKESPPGSSPTKS